MVRALLAGPQFELPPLDPPTGSDPIQLAEATVAAASKLNSWALEQQAIAFGYVATIIPLLRYSRWLPYLIATTNLQALAGNKSGTAVAVAGTSQTLDVVNRSEAWIGADALINTGADPDFEVTPAPEQRVEVRANTEIETIDVSGITDPLEVFKLLGLGASGKFGVGATNHELNLDLGARAHIDDGADVRAASDVAVRADIRQWHISFAQQGGDAPLVGASGANAALGITNDAQAWVEDTALIDAGGDIDVAATNDLFVVAVTGAMQKGGLVAAGVGISVNAFETTTRAFIGHAGGPVAAPGSPVTFIRAGGDLRVYATANVELWSFAAAAATPSKGTGSGSASFGFGVSTSIAANYIGDLTEAFVASAGVVSADGDVDVLARTTSYEVAVAGAVSLSKAKNSITLAGAFAWNELSGDGRAAQLEVDPSPRVTRAYIASTLVAGAGVRIVAEVDDKPITITASFGLALPKTQGGVTLSVAGAAAVGRYATLVEAYVGAGADVHAGGDMVVRASRSLDLLSITGALTVKGTLAAGAAIEQTLVADEVLAYVGAGATLTVAGNLEVVSTTSVTVLSLAAAQTAFANVAAAAFSSNVQKLTATGRAYLDENTVATVGNHVLIAAGETTTLSTAAGGRTVAGGAGVGLAYGELVIERVIDAGLRAGASLTQGTALVPGHPAPTLRDQLVSGITIDAYASDDLRLTVMSGAVEGALSAALSPAITIGTYMVTAGAVGATLQGRAITLGATSEPRLWALAVAGAVATGMPGLTGGGAGGGGPPIADILSKVLGLAGAAAGVSTTVTSFAKATVTGGAVTATHGPVTLRADNRPELKADAGGVGLARSKGPAQGAIGASAAVNELFMETIAAIDDAPVAASGDIALTATALPTIWALSVSGAVTASGGGGGFGISFAGAGAASSNTLTSTVAARLARNGTVTSSGGAIRLTAESDAAIYADAGAVAASLASAAGARFTGAASIGANSITQSTSATADGASLHARADVTLAAVTRGTIDALTIAGASGLSGGNGISLNFAGAGSGSATMIDSATEARIANGSAKSELGKVAVTADDESALIADAGAVAVSLAKGGVNGSVGRSVAVNEIVTSVRAGIENAPATARGDVTVIASSEPAIEARALAGAIAAGTGGGSAGATVSVVGAASGARNSITSTTDAYVRDSAVDAGGGVEVLALDESSVAADAGGFALSLLLSGAGSFISAAVGISIALNEITADTTATIESSPVIARGFLAAGTGGLVVKATSSATIDALTVAGAAGALAGVGARSQNTIDSQVGATVATSHDVVATFSVTIAASDASAVMADAGGYAIGFKFGGGLAPPTAGVGETIGVNAITVEVLAALDDSTLLAGGDVTIEAGSTATIAALTETTSDAALTGGGAGPLGSAFAGAATAAGNDIVSTTRALVTNGATVEAGGDVEMTADSSGSITADAKSGALAITTGGTSATVTLGGVTALNVISGGTHAEVGAAGTAHVVSAGGELAVTASDARSIDAFAYARTFSMNTGANAINVALGRALADNSITAAVTAIIRATQVPTAALVTVDASESGRISSTTIATASAFGWGSHTIEAAAAGAESTNRIARTVDAAIQDSTLGTQAAPVGPVAIAATSTTAIDAIVLSRGSGFVAFGKSVARNRIGFSQAAVGATYTDEPGLRMLQAGDTVLVAAGPRAGDVFRFIGPSGSSLDLALEDFADTTLWEQIGLTEIPAGVKAFVEDSSIASGGGLAITANGSQSIRALVVTNSQAASTEGAITASVAGVLAHNKIASHVMAYIDGDGPTGIAAQSVTLIATDASGIKALAGAASIAASVSGPTTVAVSVAMTQALNEVGVAVDASIRNADQGVTAAQGISLAATADGRPLFTFGARRPGCARRRGCGPGGERRDARRPRRAVRGGRARPAGRHQARRGPRRRRVAGRRREREREEPARVLHHLERQRLPGLGGDDRRHRVRRVARRHLRIDGRHLVRPRRDGGAQLRHLDGERAHRRLADHERGGRLADAPRATRPSTRSSSRSRHPSAAAASPPSGPRSASRPRGT